MRIPSNFIKLPGQRVNQAQLEAGLDQPETYGAAFWISRCDIQAVMETKCDTTDQMTASVVFCVNGDNFYCTMPAGQVIEIIDRHDREILLLSFDDTDLTPPCPCQD